ncbi:class I SAM-dependent methyltransferase [Leifsonia sp. LS-T14]|uniref:class I SAM-dependent DNA methyltransferase n=1 Tax=unclassified Leifsonia TaxID=2663824 RepID=UPI0035A60F31
MTTNTATYLGYGRDFADVYDQIFPRDAVAPAEIEWLAQHVPNQSAHILELGVGTGRIAIPLAQHLSERGTPICYRGIDVSPEMIARLAVVDTDGLISCQIDDMIDGDYPDGNDMILCVCGTLAMATAADDQAIVFRKASAALKPGGTFVVETHNPDLVQAMHQQHSITYAVPYPGPGQALVSFSELEGSDWHLDHCWIDNGTATFMSEDSRVTTLAELDAYASATGFTAVCHTAGLTGSPIEPLSGTVTAVYRK